MCGESLECADDFTDFSVDFIQLLGPLLTGEQRNTEMISDLLEGRLLETHLLAYGYHTLNSTAPLFDQ